MVIGGSNRARNQQINDNNRVKGCHSGYASFHGEAREKVNLPCRNSALRPWTKQNAKVILCRPLVTPDSEAGLHGMHGECDPILHSNLAHQLGYVRLDRAVPDAQWDADFLVRSPFYQHL
jgi:hypothetical protein